MTETGSAPTAPGMDGLPAGTEPATRRPPVRTRAARARAVIAGGIVALAVGGSAGALGSALTTAQASGPAAPQVTTVTPHVAAAPTHQAPTWSEDRGEAD